MPNLGYPCSTVRSTAARTRLDASRRKRKGVAVVEFAVCLPLLILLVIGAIDIGRALMVQHSLVEAARAGCRLYAVPQELTEDDANAMIKKVMADANLDGYSVEFDPHPSADIEHLMPVRVSVSVPFREVSWLSSSFLSGKTLVATCTMPGDTGTILADSD